MAARTSGSIEEEAGGEFEDEAGDENVDVEEEEEDERNGAALLCREGMRHADAAGLFLLLLSKYGALGVLLG